MIDYSPDREQMLLSVNELYSTCRKTFPFTTWFIFNSIHWSHNFRCMFCLHVLQCVDVVSCANEDLVKCNTMCTWICITHIAWTRKWVGVVMLLLHIAAHNEVGVNLYLVQSIKTHAIRGHFIFNYKYANPFCLPNIW